jgi:hypothetical protein
MLGQKGAMIDHGDYTVNRRLFFYTRPTSFLAPSVRVSALFNHNAKGKVNDG